MTTVTTLTGNAGNQVRVPRSVEYVEISQQYNRSASASVSETFAFEGLRIPHGATIRRVVVQGGTSDGKIALRYGIVGGITSEALFGSATASATSQVDSLIPGVGVGPYKVSCSDDQILRYVTVAATVQANSSVTGSLSLCVTVGYTMTPPG